MDQDRPPAELYLLRAYVVRGEGSTAMMDFIMLAIGLGFFVLSIGYCYACDRL